ncbi:McrC family protein [Niallia nealsonii]|uniref:Restriction endonuclease n=1 Tax=Niallia nealsonii TaxID=115979 RepID=A0A2N0Z435_9BACI|nr:McrC family protein [Niallia nealsonii]PKG24272.1 restriction endonuclease [Niallia nealsonii]
MRKLLEVKEFDSITCNTDFINDGHYKFLDEVSFSYLEELILNIRTEEEADALDFFTLTSKRSVGKVIRAKNYVGIVQLKNGTQIQILPKVDSSDSADTKRIFLRMLKSMKDFPSKIFSDTHVNIDKMSIYEVFINLYIQEVRNLVKKGIKSKYYSLENNSRFYKGKLVLNEHIKRNFVHKEQFYVSYDEYGLNRPENRLIKATLIKLLKLSSNYENIREIGKLLPNFETIETSKNYDKDFSKVINDRTTKDYDILICWSKVFLRNKSFTTFSGNTSARALLFPMEKVFEAYVGRNLKRALVGTDWNISLQDKGYYLFERQFALRPDILIEKENRRIILDTKWKRLRNEPRYNYGISQTDMYQMYAYAKKYNTNEIWLLYPINDEMINAESIEFTSDDSVVVKVFFVDVSNINESINELIGFWD